MLMPCSLSSLLPVHVYCLCTRARFLFVVQLIPNGSLPTVQASYSGALPSQRIKLAPDPIVLDPSLYVLCKLQKLAKYCARGRPGHNHMVSRKATMTKATFPLILRYTAQIKQASQNSYSKHSSCSRATSRVQWAK